MIFVPCTERLWRGLFFSVGKRAVSGAKLPPDPPHGPRGRRAVCQRFNASRAPFRTVAPTRHVLERGGFLVSRLDHETHTSGFPMKVGKRNQI